MRVLVIEPGKSPEMREIENNLETKQRIVGGWIEAVYPFDDPVALICNEEGKHLGLPYNRALRHPETGEVYDIIAGTFILCAASPESENFDSLDDVMLEKYTEYFAHPEVFLSVNGSLMVLRM